MAHGALISEVEQWLIGKALADPEIATLFRLLCQRLHALGIPIDRAAVSWPTLHPLFRAEQAVWKPDEGVKLMQFEHDDLGTQSDLFLKSPFYHVHKKNLTKLRRRLSGPEARLDFDILEDLRDEGYTDYLLTATRFRIAEAEHFAGGSTGIMATWSTKRESGFSSNDFDGLSRIQQVFAVACHASIQKRVMANIADAYLGPTAGARVLEGDIRRGDGRRIPAVLWFSDLRGSTRLSEQMAPDDYLALLNRYFECTAQPVIDNGGEILNFIGDGVLAIFPISEDCPREAALGAEKAVQEALLRRLQAAECILPDGERLDFGIGLSVGEVMFGNIGVPSRLAFSSIGREVNQLHRIEAATKHLGVPVLADSAFVELASAEWISAGHSDLREGMVSVELFTLPAAGEEQPWPSSGTLSLSVS
ncbi:MAG: adenylate/guanylate cyclase domain-containing protein [Pseudomonadota bacterium]